MKNIFLLLCLFVSACSAQTYKLGIVSPSQSSFSYSSVEKASVTPDVSAATATPIVLFIPIGHPNLEKTIQEVLRKGGGNVLIDATVTEETDWFVLFGFRRLNISGTVVNTQN